MDMNDESVIFDEIENREKIGTECWYMQHSREQHLLPTTTIPWLWSKQKLFNTSWIDYCVVGEANSVSVLLSCLPLSCSLLYISSIWTCFLTHDTSFCRLYSPVYFRHCQPCANHVAAMWHPFHLAVWVLYTFSCSNQSAVCLYPLSLWFSLSPNLTNRRSERLIIA